MKSHLLPTAIASVLSVFAGAQSTVDRNGQATDVPQLAQTPAAGDFQVSASALNGVGLTEIDGQTVAVGPNYRSLYDGERVLFHPALGTLAPTTQHLEFRLESIELGGEPLIEITPTQPSIEGNAVHYDRGLVLERYEATSAGVEQTFTLHERQAGTGDLVVRGRIETSLPWDGIVDSKGLSFVDPVFGGVTIGGVTGVDANGATTAGEVRFDGMFVEYVLPASFVANAAYPLVLDPLIGNADFIDNIDGIGRGVPDVAYDSFNDRFLAVWHVIYALDDFDIHAAELNEDGSNFGAVQVVRLTVGTVSAIPSVGYANNSDGFMIAWSEGSLFGERDILGRAFMSVTGTLGVTGDIATGLTNQTSPVVAGDSFNGASGENTIVGWQDTTDGIWVALVRPEFGNVPIVSTVTQVFIGPNFSEPAISESGGLDGNWIVTASRFFSSPAPGDTDISVAVVDFTLALDVPEFRFGEIGPNESASSVDGNGSEFVIAWQTDEAGDLDVRYRSVDSTGLLGISREILNGNTLDQSSPEVSFTGNKYIVSCEYFTSLGGNLAIQEICASNLEICQSFTPLLSTAFNRENLGLASKRSGNLSDTSDEGMFVWQDNDLDQEPSILGQAFDGSVGGPVENLGGGCGAAISVNTLSPPSLGNAQFGWSVDVPASANFVLLNARFNPLAPFICGSCQIQADLGIVLAAPVISGNAVFTTPLPGTPGLLGRTVTTQFFVLPTNESPCSLFNNVSASDRIRITVRN